jgi:hypothetical protein
MKKVLASSLRKQECAMFGPSRLELWFRLLASLAGLAFMLVAVSIRGVSGMAWVEVVGLSSVFFGGTAIWAGFKLRTQKGPRD